MALRSMLVSDTTFHGPQARYWKQFTELKTASILLRKYRDHQSRWIRYIGITKAVATSSTIAGWVIWKDYAIIWGIIIGISQLFDAVKDYVPQQNHRRAASELAALLESLFIDAADDWNCISEGQLTSQEITKKWQKLARLQMEAEKKYFSDSLELSDTLKKSAISESQMHFLATYG